jgi:hypothetical protein
MRYALIILIILELLSLPFIRYFKRDEPKKARRKEMARLMWIYVFLNLLGLVMLLLSSFVLRFAKNVDALHF